MAEEASNIHEIKTSSDGFVKITVEKYNELVEKAATKAPVINRTIVNKTAEMLAEEHRMWGTTFMGLGVSFFLVGALLYRSGRSQS